MQHFRRDGYRMTTRRASKMIAIAAISALAVGASSGVRVIGGSITPAPVGGGGGAWADTFGACTPGTDCFCDLIDTTGTVNGGYSNVFWCADFDHDAFYETNPTHVNDAYGNKNWISTVGAEYGSGDRGGGSRWAKLYKGTWGGFTWEDGEPTTTCGGVITNVGGSGIGSGPLEWDAADRWCANAYSPRIDIVKTAADFSAENGSTQPTIPGSGGANVFGNYMLGLRNITNGEQGFASEEGAFGDHAQLGVTAAVNYESNVIASTILSNPWKHDEFGGVSGGINDGLFMFRQSWSTVNTFPIQGFMFPIGFTCSTALASVTQTIGTAECDDAGNVIWRAEEGLGVNEYKWPDDWNTAEHHCVSAHWDFRTITAVRARFWVDGDLVMDISNINLDGSVYDGNGGTNGIDEFNFNNYSNQAGAVGLTATTRRYMDNYVMRDGTPVLCEDIGFPSSYNQAGL